MKAKISEILQALFGTVLFGLVIIPFIYIWIPRWILSSPEYSKSFQIGTYRYLGLIPIVVGIVLWIYCSGSFVFVGIGTPVPRWIPRIKPYKVNGSDAA